METIQTKIVDQIGAEGESAIHESGVRNSGSTAPERAKEKIDPIKLVLYSEIMKPKYTEKY